MFRKVGNWWRGLSGPAKLAVVAGGVLAVAACLVFLPSAIILLPGAGTIVAYSIGAYALAPLGGAMALGAGVWALARKAKHGKKLKPAVAILASAVTAGALTLVAQTPPNATPAEKTAESARLQVSLRDAGYVQPGYLVTESSPGVVEVKRSDAGPVDPDALEDALEDEGYDVTPLAAPTTASAAPAVQPPSPAPPTPSRRRGIVGLLGR